MITKIYNLIFKFFRNRIGSDEFTSKSAGLSLTTGLIFTVIVVLTNLLAILIFNYDFLKGLNAWYFLILFFVLYPIIMKFVKSKVE
jgi:hypothetical protein